MSPEGDPVAALVREADFGLYASTLFAPAAVRPHLLALYAFDVEIGRVRELVSEPMPGELRLQWWRDVLADPGRADAASHPTARALEAAIAFGRLPRASLLDLIDARVDDLYDDPPDTMHALEARLGATDSAVLRLAALISAEGREPGGAEVAGYGGVARGLARTLRLLPRHAARGQILLPVDRMAAHGVARDDLVSGRGGPGVEALVAELRVHAAARLGEARAAFGRLAAAAHPAALPLALVAPELDALGRARSALDPLSPRPRWRTLLRLWWACRRTPPF